MFVFDEYEHLLKGKFSDIIEDADVNNWERRYERSCLYDQHYLLHIPSGKQVFEDTLLLTLLPLNVQELL